MSHETTGPKTPQYILPTPEDNVAIVPRRLEAGTTVLIEGVPRVLAHPVLQGHRICVRPIARGAALTSWGMPFGHALADLLPGDYVCNEKMRQVLLARHPGEFPADLPVTFRDRDTVADRTLPEHPEYGPNVPTRAHERTFPGFHRGPKRGWGTRNHLAIIGVTSRSRAAVFAAAARLAEIHPATADFDGVVPVVHTEAGGATAPANKDLLLRTLAGFAVNPNVGAAVFVGDPDNAVSNAEVLAALAHVYADPQEYAVRFCLAADAGDEAVEGIVRVAETVAPRVVAQRRTPAPLSALRVGLQCGGSDAFSGASANQVLGDAMFRLVDHGGAANLAETDELIGSEVHTLARVAEPGVTDRFLSVQQRFKDYAAAHGHTAEGNVSGGNIYRGLYNITLKSLGASRKKDPRLAIDYVIDYGEPMTAPGYCFMDSPGNDLESIAGQVAAGCNLIIFTTGNGSITNFPFVPTLKVVTTTERFTKLESDMDFNAGRMLDGLPLSVCGEELFELALATAGGVRSKGEASGQSQTQIWRSWSDHPVASARPAGHPLVAAAAAGGDLGAGAPVSARVDLVLPTSLCSGQVAEQIAHGESAPGPGQGGAGLPVIALPHTEGCGVSSGSAEEIFRDTLIGYATHPYVGSCVFLEHGCEKTHNDYFHSALAERGVDAGAFGWASIQGDGGIAAATAHVRGLLGDRDDAGAPAAGRLDGPVVGIATGRGAADGLVAEAIEVIRGLLAQGGSVLVAQGDPLLADPRFRTAFGIPGTGPVAPTLAYAGVVTEPGLHVMELGTGDWLEAATGMGACGALALLVFTSGRPWQPHRFIPTVQVGAAPVAGLDVVLSGASEAAPTRAGGEGSVRSALAAALAGEFASQTPPRADVGFQLTRGALGISM
ncbi:altronate dehydratase family protein [Brevibacterium sp. 50QC2O2]|uniref:altronate dehydratase family protein n=1 Tax=Brevibacterium sp. 50QC2O2 TaxID=2968459 RepID=UPI00211B99F3|nr:altronate dehydratase family protein [Brevibacterium sp. 50QC2O2]MCQ9388194.1 altronate dehydratase family protein [Brevibacterium sp. 50QC2O2]